MFQFACHKIEKRTFEFLSRTVQILLKFTQVRNRIIFDKNEGVLVDSIDIVLREYLQFK